MFDHKMMHHLTWVTYLSFQTDCAVCHGVMHIREAIVGHLHECDIGRPAHNMERGKRISTALQWLTRVGQRIYCYIQNN